MVMGVLQGIRNIGDHLIHRGTEVFYAEYGHPIVARAHVYSYRRGALVRRLRPDTVLLCAGGGHLGCRTGMEEHPFVAHAVGFVDKTIEETIDAGAGLTVQEDEASTRLQDPRHLAEESRFVGTVVRGRQADQAIGAPIRQIHVLHGRPHHGVRGAGGALVSEIGRHLHRDVMDLGPLQFAPLVSPWYHLPHISLGDAWRVSGIDNQWDRDVALKVAFGLPASVFQRAGDLLGLETDPPGR